ncbi:hypothetical protein D3C86_1455560 [compost metagenome]
MRKSPIPDSAEAPATLAMVIGPLKFFTESSPNSIFFNESRVSRLIVQVRRKPSATASNGPKLTSRNISGGHSTLATPAPR